MRMGMGVLLLLLLLLCIIHGSAGLSLQSPIVSRTHKYAPGPQIQDLVPPIPPSPATAMPLPSDKSAPLPQTMPHFTPSVSPSSPVVLPSHKAAPLPQTIPHFAPSSPPNSPIVVPSNKSAPPPEVMPKVEPSISPSPVVPVPSHNSAPLPQTMPEVKPSIPPSPPVLVPSHNSAPPSQTMPDVKPSIPPSSPVLVPSNNSTPPQTMPEVKPPIPSSPTVLVPSHKSPPPPQTEPQIEPSISPNPSNEVPTHTLVPLPEPMQSSPPVVVPSLNSTHLPQPIPQLAPSMPPNPPIIVPPHKLAPRPQTIPGIIPSLPPNDSPHKKEPEMPLPVPLPHAQAPVALTPMKSQQKPSAKHSIMPGVAPSTLPEPAAAPLSFPPLAAQPKETFKHLSPKNHFPRKGLHNVTRPSANVLAPHNSSPEQPKSKWIHSPAPLPSVPFYKHHHAKKRAISPPLAPHYSIAPTTHQGPIVFPSPSHTSPDPSHASTAPQTPTAHSLPPVTSPKKRSERRHNPVPSVHGPLSPVEPPFPSVSPFSQGSPAPLASSTVPVGRTKRPVLSPLFSPPRASPAKPKATLPPPVRALPPPPPNQDCSSVTCAEPLTNSPPGSPCVCVWPIKVGLRFGVAPYAFFPLVSELAEELASGVFMKQSQVRIMGANAASQQLDKTDVLIDLVPLGENFDRTTAFLIYQKFWHKQVSIKTSFFGDYEVLYVTYPGLPPSPPSAALDIDTGGGYNQGNNARAIHPLGVDVRRKHKHGLGGSTIAIIVLSSFAAVVLCIGAAWILLLKRGGHTRLAASTPQASGPSLAKQSGGGGSMFGSGLSSTSLSFGSSITTYTGSAKTFSADEVEKATNNFDASRIIGEGGFGRVYKGILEDGAEVAIKVLKRDDQQGGREFLAEVEMLSRLHHRNLVKLIGICIEEQSRSLMYELIPNGSLESHLHGLDKETASLDWGARMKIALGAARGLAYLHEDSSPHVIHRDFKSSNILLEHDFTPKVSDFGLAKSALDEGNKHISTRVMGTFGYVAPEYAMTGHLLVKSDVYSYGVVLLELLTGRKPVDMSQPQGQENLVAWARPLLTSKEGLEMIIDPTLASNCLFDSVAKVAAIASMCVQPEVSHRPFMGEVVQALKLVCTECDEAKEAESESLGQEDLSVVDIDIRTSTGSGQFGEPSHTRCPDYDSALEAGRPLSTSYIFNTSGGFEQQESGSFRRHSSSGPLRTGRRRQFWQRVRGPSRGSVSEHGATFRLWGGSH